MDPKKVDLDNIDLDTQESLDEAIKLFHEDSDTQDDDKNDSEGSGEPLVDDSDEQDDTATETDDGDSEAEGGEVEEGDSGSAEQPAPLEDRLKEVEKQFKPEPEQDPIKVVSAQLEQLNQQIAQLQQNNFYAQKPVGDIYQPEGKHVFDMSEQQLNDYVQFLQDDGKHIEAAKVQKAVLEANDRGHREVAQFQQLQQQREALEQTRHQHEWNHVEADWLGKFPEIKPHVQGVYKLLEQEVQTNPQAHALSQSLGGKTQLVYEALKHLGIFDKIREARSDAGITESKPSAPDAKAGSKRVKTQTKPSHFTRAQIKAMSQAEYLANEAAIDEAMVKKLIS